MKKFEISRLAPDSPKFQTSALKLFGANLGPDYKANFIPD